ncbi:MAG: type II toxin-antitoxin system VapC family toxin [Candidatus Korobacteraceae bacterium]
MIILDTNVISAVMRRPPEDRVVFWLDQQPQTSIWTTSITVFEIRYGIEIMEAGRRRSSLAQSFDGLLGDLGNRVVPLDAEAAENAAALMAVRHKKGRPVGSRDTMIAGIALARHATIATRNTAHFEDAGVAIVNPWTA